MIETKPRINRGNRGQLFRATWLLMFIFKLIRSFDRSCVNLQHFRSRSLAVKGTMSSGFYSFFVITLLIIQVVTLFYAQNVAFTAKGRYQVNCRIDTKLLLVLIDFSKTQRYNLKKLAQLADSLDTLI